MTLVVGWRWGKRIGILSDTRVLRLDRDGNTIESQRPDDRMLKSVIIGRLNIEHP